MCMYCETTNETISQALEQPINFILYIVSYAITLQKEKEKQYKQKLKTIK